jgi:hypothetical protein
MKSRKVRMFERLQDDLKLMGVLDPVIRLGGGHDPRERQVMGALVRLEKLDLPLDAIGAVHQLALALITRALDVPTDEPDIPGARKRMPVGGG